MAYCKVRKADIYYEDIGEGTPILMIHGFAPDHRLMSGCMEPIFTDEKGCRRIYIDLPGMGQTKNYDEVSNSDEMLDTVLDFIQEVIPNQKFLLAGESYGGYLARGIIEKQPENVLGATFICPVIYPLHKDRTLVQHTVIQKDEEFLKTLSKEELEDFSQNQVVLNETIWHRYNAEVLSGCKIADEEFLSKIEKQYALSFEVDQAEFTKPCLFLLGRQDSVVGYQDALNVIDKYPRGTFAVVDTAGHNLQIEQPQLLHSFVNEWLNRVAETLGK